MAIAEGLFVDGCWWVIDWEKMTSSKWKDNDPVALNKLPKHGPPTAFWNGGIVHSICSATGKKYSAARNLAAVRKKDEFSEQSLC